MSPQSCDVEIAAFIRAKGVTRCPTACVAPSQSSGSAADRAALRHRAEQLELARQQKIHEFWIGAAPAARSPRPSATNDPIRLRLPTAWDA